MYFFTFIFAHYLRILCALLHTFVTNPAHIIYHFSHKIYQVFCLVNLCPGL
ncbi:MAG: hypothetical protein K0Q79_1839 [Flavipsychrobacter sp.]|jgi:hypothetical protein|nr:hypothetical protein [Flavipsychrobacter sp.]